MVKKYSRVRRTFQHNLVLVLLIMCQSEIPLFAAEYEVDSAHTNVMFTIRHLLGRFTGAFRDIEAKFRFDDKNPGKSSGKFTVRVDNLNTGVEARDAHLRSADFFDTAKHPTMQFQTIKVTAVGPRHYKLSGYLTIRSITKPITFDVQYFGSAISIDGDRKASFMALAKVNRKDFGVSWNKIVDRNLWIIGDKVDITMNIEARELGRGIPAGIPADVLKQIK